MFSVLVNILSFTHAGELEQVSGQSFFMLFTNGIMSSYIQMYEI